MEPALAIFGKLIGLCFAATMPSGVQDTHCFSKLYDSAHVRDTHIVRRDKVSIYEGETTYSETPAGLEFIYLSSLGGSGHGTVRIEGDVLTFDMTMRADASASPMPIHSVWRLTGDGYDVETPGKPALHFGLAR